MTLCVSISNSSGQLPLNSQIRTVSANANFLNVLFSNIFENFNKLTNDAQLNFVNSFSVEILIVTGNLK